MQDARLGFLVFIAFAVTVGFFTGWGVLSALFLVGVLLAAGYYFFVRAGDKTGGGTMDVVLAIGWILGVIAFVVFFLIPLLGNM